MKTAVRLLTLAIGALFLSSCIQHSTVVRVRKDGSGEIFARYYFSPTLMGMMGGLAAGLGDPNAAPAEVPDPSKPNLEDLKSEAAAYGEGVRYVRHETGKNKDQWDGYTVVYEFDDINKVELNSDAAMQKFENMGGDAAAEAVAEAEAAQEEAGAESGKVSFEMADGVLKIKTNMGSAGMGDFQDQGGDQLPPGTKPSQMMAGMAGMFQGMRMGYYIRIDGGIAETNATHVADANLITMSDIDFVKMITDPDFAAFVDEAAENPDSVTEESTKAVMEKIEGARVEMQEEVTVKFN
ncbi:MAG: hypothetical protein HKN23_06655 [Verrucomicrobiales bacterium]|nr:hypothetical protein [Verrucomicrobiales bacterium]